MLLGFMVLCGHRLSQWRGSQWGMATICYRDSTHDSQLSLAKQPGPACMHLRVGEWVCVCVCMQVRDSVCVALLLHCLFGEKYRGKKRDQRPAMASPCCIWASSLLLSHVLCLLLFQAPCIWLSLVWLQKIVCPPLPFSFHILIFCCLLIHHSCPWYAFLPVSSLSFLCPSSSVCTVFKECRMCCSAASFLS